MSIEINNYLILIVISKEKDILNFNLMITNTSLLMPKENQQSLECCYLCLFT